MLSVLSGCPQSESRLYKMAHLPLQAFFLSAFTNSRSLSKLLAVKTCLFPSVAMNFNSLRLYAPTPTAIIVRSKMKHKIWPSTVFFVLRRGLSAPHKIEWKPVWYVNMAWYDLVCYDYIIINGAPWIIKFGYLYI